MGFPGPALVTCCLIWSLWGVITMLIIALLFFVEYPNIVMGQFKDSKTYSHAGVQSFIAAAIYGGCIIGCGLRLFCIKLSKKSSVEI